MRELALGAAAAGLMAAMVPWAREPWLQSWIAILAAAAALFAVWRYRVLFRRRGGANAESLAAFCRAEISRLETEIRLQRTLAWWYLLPIFLGTNLYVLLASRGSFGVPAFFAPLSLALVVGIGIATRRSLRRELHPRRQELVHCLAELEAGPTG